MLYSYGSFLSKLTLSLLCIVVPVPYVSINPSKKRQVQVVLIYYLNMKQKKRIKCPICGNYDYPTRDHVPPKSCNNTNDVIRSFVFPTETGFARKEISQGGLTFSFICSKCNNEVLGIQSDKELRDLFETVLNSNDVNIKWIGSIEKIVKSVFGHILATDVFSNVTYDKEMRNYVNKDVFPKNTHLYLLFYPYKDVFLIRSVVPIQFFPRKLSIKPKNEMAMVSCFYFHPLAFIVTDSDYYPLAVDLTKLISEHKNEIVLNRYSFTNILTGKPFPPCWPCAIGDSDENDTVDSIVSGKEGRSTQLVIERKQ